MRMWNIINKNDSKIIVTISPRDITTSKNFEIREAKPIGQTDLGEDIFFDISKFTNSTNDLIRLLRLALIANRDY